MRVLSLLISALGITAIALVWQGHWAETTLAVRIASAIVVAASVASIAVASLRARVAIAQVLLATAATFSASRVAGAWPFTWDALPDRRYAAFLTIVALATVIGLHYRALWARWVGFGFAAAGGIGGVINGIGMRGHHDDGAWLAAIGAFGCALVIAQLASPVVREGFTKPSGAVWTSRDPIVKLVRWSAIAAIAAVPMLLVYALAQPIVPATVWSALALAPVLAIGAVLVLRQKIAGVLVLGVAGAGLIAQTIATKTCVIAWYAPVANYYLAFWLPAGVMGVAAMAATLWRGRSMAALPAPRS